MRSRIRLLSMFRFNFHTCLSGYLFYIEYLSLNDCRLSEYLIAVIGVHSGVGKKSDQLINFQLTIQFSTLAKK